MPEEGETISDLEKSNQDEAPPPEEEEEEESKEVNYGHT